MSAEARYDQLVIEDKTALARIQADLSKMENKFNTYVTNLEEENRIAQEKQNEHEDLKEEKRRLKKKLDEMIKDASSIMGFLRFFWAEIMKFFSGS